MQFFCQIFDDGVLESKKRSMKEFVLQEAFLKKKKQFFMVNSFELRSKLTNSKNFRILHFGQSFERFCGLQYLKQSGRKLVVQKVS